MRCRPSNHTLAAAMWLIAVVLSCILVITGRAAQAQDTVPQGERAERQESQAPGQGKWNVSTLSIAGSGGAEALRVERMDPPQIRAGQPYEYHVVVRNTSDNPVYGVVVRERIPKGVQIEQSTPQRSQDSAVGENVWRLGTLDPGETTSIRVSATPPDPGAIQACLTVDYQPTLCTQAMVVQPALKLERQLVDAQGRPRDRILACEDPFLAYRLTNVGSGVTQPAQISEELHDPFRTAQGAQVIDLNAGRLEAGQPYEQRVPLHVVKPSGEYTGYAVATTDNLRVRSSQGTVAVVKPDLTLTMSGPQQEFIDRPVTYTVKVQNQGSGPALDTAVRVQLAANAEDLSFVGDGIRREGETFHLGRLDPGASREFSVTFDATEPSRAVTQAVAEAYCADATQAQVATLITGIPAVRLELIDLKDPVQVGEETVYEIRIKNQGSAEDLNVTVQGQLPAELKFIDGRGDTAVQAQGQAIQFGPIQHLAPGAMVTWYVKAKAVDPGVTQLKLQMTSDANQRPVTEQEPTTLY